KRPHHHVTAAMDGAREDDEQGTEAKRKDLYEMVAGEPPRKPDEQHDDHVHGDQIQHLSELFSLGTRQRDAQQLERILLEMIDDERPFDGLQDPVGRNDQEEEERERQGARPLVRTNVRKLPVENLS